MLPIDANGVRYPSLKAAYDALSPPELEYITVYMRIVQGWDPEDALLIPPVPPAERRRFALRRMARDLETPSDT